MGRRPLRRYPIRRRNRPTQSDPRHRRYPPHAPRYPVADHRMSQPIRAARAITAHDLQGREMKCTISLVKSERINDEEKLVIYFVGEQKSLVLNKTNATAIASKYGPNVETWAGAEVTLFPASVDFRGKQTQA